MRLLILLLLVGCNKPRPAPPRPDGRAAQEAAPRREQSALRENEEAAAAALARERSESERVGEKIRRQMAQAAGEEPQYTLDARPIRTPKGWDVLLTLKVHALGSDASVVDDPWLVESIASLEQGGRSECGLEAPPSHQLRAHGQDVFHKRVNLAVKPGELSLLRVSLLVTDCTDTFADVEVRVPPHGPASARVSYRKS